jgi:hypothetical protein
MRQLSRVFAVAGVLVLAGSVGLEAQARKFVSIGGGLTMPTGDFKNDEEAKSGWMTGAAFGTGIGSGNLFVMASGFYGKNGSDHDEDETSTLAGGTVNLGVMSRGEMARIYGYVGGGLQNYSNNEHQEENGTSVLGNAAVGVNIGRGNTRFWVQGGLAMNKTASYIPVLAGISFGF